ncbi:MAG: hypothetical protein U9P38_06205, partial [Campylobacterota bacterium]|nr:hypothetical protein [Campylobacterota bacterium]
KIVLILIISINLFGSLKESMFTLYQNKQYKKACIKGASQFNKFRNNEGLISLYGFSCLKANFIDKLSIPIVILKKSKDARSNAAYFSIILMQKKLLYRSLLDGEDISSLNLPTTKHIFSKVFDLYSKLKNSSSQNSYTLIDEEDKDIMYKLYTQKHKKSYLIVIEEFYKNLQVKKHIYR